MKSIFKVLGTLVVLVGLTVYLRAACAPTDMFCYETGSQASPTVQCRCDASGNLTLNGVVTSNGSGASTVTGATTFSSTINATGKIINGTSGVAQSTATTTTNVSMAIPVYIANFSNAPSQGMVIIATNPVVGQGVSGMVGTTSDLKSVLGIADVTASTAAVLNVNYSGIAVALTTGTVVAGDILVSTVAAAGYLAANNSPTEGTIVGTALSNGITSGGLTRILLHLK